MPLSDALLPEFDNEIASTRKVLERVPEDKLDWRPHDRSYTLGELASHIANLPRWATMTMESDSYDMAPPGKDPEKGEVFRSNAAILAGLDKNAGDARNAVADAADDDFFDSWTLLSGGHEILTMPRIAVLRSFVMNHIIHHRGQLTVYLRLLDVPLPAIYGPTADENPGM